MLLAVGPAVPGVGLDSIPGDVTAVFLPMSVAVLLLGLAHFARFPGPASGLECFLSVAASLSDLESSSLSSRSDMSLPTIDSGVNAYSDKERKAEGDEKVAETEAGDAVEALSGLVSSFPCPCPWVTAL